MASKSNVATATILIVSWSVLFLSPPQTQIQETGFNFDFDLNLDQQNIPSILENDKVVASSQLNAMWIYIPSVEPECAGIPGEDKHEWTSTNNNTALFTDAFLDFLIDYQIFDLFLLEANVSPGYETTFRNQDGVTALLNQLAAKDARFHLWAWIATYPHSVEGQVDLSTSGNRAAMIDTLVDYAEMGFYGIQDDIEDVTAGTTWANKVAFWNAETVALNNIGVKCCVYTDNSDLSGIYADYIFLAEWIWTDPEYNNWMKSQLNSADSPCLIGINCWGSGIGMYTETLLAWADALPQSNFARLVGCAIYTDYALLASEWEDWYNWEWKNLSEEEPEVVATPTFDPVAGTYGAVQNVEVSSVTDGAVLYYTLDGSTPDSGDTLYEGAVEIATSKTLKAIGVKDGLTDSAVGTAVYVINLPPPTPAPIVVIAHIARLMRD